jgi:hypothetical protein
MVIEMLLNNDIQLFFCSNDFILSKEKNLIMYIIEKKLKVNSNHFIWTKFQ